MYVFIVGELWYICVYNNINRCNIILVYNKYIIR